MPNKFKIGDVVSYIGDPEFRGRICGVPGLGSGLGSAHYRMTEIVPSDKLAKIFGLIQLSEQKLVLVQSGHDLIGPMPEPVRGPIFPTPWASAGNGRIRDAKGGIVTVVSGSTTTREQDHEVAQMIVDAINEKYGDPR